MDGHDKNRGNRSDCRGSHAVSIGLESNPTPDGRGGRGAADYGRMDKQVGAAAFALLLQLVLGALFFYRFLLSLRRGVSSWRACNREDRVAA